LQGLDLQKLEQQRLWGARGKLAIYFHGDMLAPLDLAKQIHL